MANLPRIAEAQPLVGLLDLPTVLDLLMKHSKLIADTVANGGHVQSCEGLHVTGRQPSQAAVAESGLRFLSQQHIQIKAQIGDGLLDLLANIADIEQIVS